MDSAGIEETIDSLRVHVRRGLDRFLLGQYFTEYGLAEDAVLIPDGVDEDNLEAAGLTEKHSPFQLFLKAVASEIVKEKGETKGRKKRIREYLEVLQAFQEEWVHYIRKNMRKKVKHTATPFVTMEPPAPKDAGDKNKDGGTDSKKKGGKRGPRGPYKKRKKKEEPSTPEPKSKPEPDHPEPTPKRQKVLDIDQLRKEFEEERDSIMAQVPEYNKKYFKQVGFAKWSKTYLPAMCLSPYAVPPGDIRDQWMKMFQNVKSKDRMNRMSHLVWWIGSKEEMGTYSVVARNQFLTYDEGQKKGMHEVPKKIKKLLEQGKKLSSAQQEQVEGLQQLNELALLAPDDREHPTGNFEEEDFWGYDEEELLQGDTAMEVEEEEEEEELLDDDEDEELVDSDVEVEKKKKRKYKKAKKEKALTNGNEEDAEEVIYDDIVEVPPEPPKKKDKKTKLERGRKKEKNVAEQQSNFAAVDSVVKREPVDNELKDTEEVQFPPSSPPVAPAQAPVKAERLSLAEFLGDDEASAGGDSALEDSDYGGDVDVEDEDVGKEVIPAAKKTKKLKKKTSNRKDGQDNSDEKSTKKKKKEKKDKEPKQPKKRTKAAEQRDLDRCVYEYLPMIDKLKAAKDKKDIAAIQKKLEVLLPVSDEFAASFFSEYEIPKLMKSTKTVLEEAGGGDLLSVYRKLWNRMKASYTEKAKHLPEGFKPKKRTPSVKSTEDDEPALRPVKVESDLLPQSSPARDQDIVPVKIESVKVESDSVDVSGARRISEIENQGTPMKIPIKQESSRRLSATSEQSAKASEKTAPTQPKPKKFSVMDFMRKKKETPRDSTSTGAGTDKMTSSGSRGGSGKKSVPDWVSAPPPTTFDSFVGSDRREDRLFALEFLLQAAAHFPAGKGVNEESVARGLEKAVYEWSDSQNKCSSWSDVYWDKIHAVVAAITGKREIGTLVSMIMDGQFSSPTAIVMLSDEDLEHSFEGRPLLSSSE